MRSLGKHDEHSVEIVGVGHETERQRGSNEADCNRSFFWENLSFLIKLEIFPFFREYSYLEIANQSRMPRIKRWKSVTSSAET